MTNESALLGVIAELYSDRAAAIHRATVAEAKVAELMRELQARNAKKRSRGTRPKADPPENAKSPDGAPPAFADEAPGAPTQRKI